MSEDRVSLLPLYVSPRRSGRLVGALFVITAALCWIAVGYRLAEIRHIAGMQQGQALEPAVHAAYAFTGDVLAAAQLVMGGLLAATLVPWLFRARVNVRALGMRQLRFRREWAVFGFFVPVLNVLRPYQVVREVWQASDPASADPTRWRLAPVPALVPLWWGTLLGFAGLQLASSLLLDLATGLARVQLAHALGLAANGCAALSASFGYLVVARISGAQDAKRALCADGAPLPFRPLDPRDVVV